MNPVTTTVMLAATLLSFALGITGDYLIGAGFLGGTVVVFATLANLFAVTGYPHLLKQGAEPGSVAFFAIPAIFISLLFGLVFFSWGWGLAYAMFAMVAYLVSGVVALKN